MSAPLRTLDDVVTRLSELEARYAAIRDRRAVFLTVYALETTRRIEASRFRDATGSRATRSSSPILYCVAQNPHDCTSVAEAGATAFDTATRGSALVTQDLLDVINHDLALALHEVSIGPDRLARLEDHRAVNDVLEALTDDVGSRVSGRAAIH